METGLRGYASMQVNPKFTAEAKIAALRDAGVHVVEPLGDIGPTARRILDTLP
jgi:succinyl-CoA synthetase alpha subunit